MFDDLIHVLCRDIGLEIPAGGTDGAFYLQVNELEIGLVEEPDNESLVLQCTVGSVGADPRAGLFEELCQANYYFTATNGATLGYNPSTGEIVLAREWALAGLDGRKLAKLLEGFVAAAEFWRGRIGGTGAAPAATATLDSHSSMIRA